MEASVTLSRDAVEKAEADGQAAVLPMPSVPVTSDRSSAAAVTVELPAGITTSKVEIPVEDVTPGTVAVAVLPDGTEQVIRHYDVTGKICPKYYVEHEEAWLDLLAGVEAVIPTFAQ